MKKNKVIAGVDEVGRGCLAGPVVSAAVILKKGINLKQLKDSKKLTFIQRKNISNYIKENSIFSVGISTVKEIEKLNILQASLLSMKRAIQSLTKKPDIILIDGIFSAGGFNDQRANYKFVEILRINRNGNAFKKRYKVSLGSNYSEKHNPILNDGDSVWVKKNKFAKMTDTLGIVASPLKDIVTIWTFFKLND